MRKSTYFPLYLLSNKQSDPSVSSHIVLGDDRGDKDLKLASVPRGYQKYRRGILLKAPLIQHLASNLKPKSNISPNLCNQNSILTNHLEIGNLYRQLHLLQPELQVNHFGGLMPTHDEVPIMLFTLQIPSIIKEDDEERGKPPDTKGL